MTAQTADSLIYLDEDYSIVAGHGSELFHPRDKGIRPRMVSTACWRGYYCQYKIEDDQFKLDSFWVGQNVALPEVPYKGWLSWLPPKKPYKREMVHHENVNEVIPFTGEILIARDFIEKLYKHLGIQAAWKFKKVYHAVFEDGSALEINDRSEYFEELRDKLTSDPEPNFTIDDYPEWMKKFVLPEGKKTSNK